MYMKLLIEGTREFTLNSHRESKYAKKNCANASQTAETCYDFVSVLFDFVVHKNQNI